MRDGGKGMLCRPSGMDIWLLTKEIYLQNTEVKMKKTTLLFLLLVLTVALSAQVSLFGLQFGAKTDDVKALLKSKGFGDGQQNGSIIVYTPTADSKLPKIALTLSDDLTLLDSWDITYYFNGNPDMMIDILNNIAQIHGEVSVIDDYGVDYIWYFPNNHVLYVYEYNDRVLLDYTDGNWDDDEYYWYEEFYW